MQHLLIYGANGLYCFEVRSILVLVPVEGAAIVYAFCSNLWSVETAATRGPMFSIWATGVLLCSVFFIVCG